MKVEAPWAKVPLHILKDDSLTMGDIRVYGALDFLAGKRGWWYGTWEDIAKAAGTSRPTVARAVERLREKGYVSTQKMGIRYAHVLRYLTDARLVEVDDTASDITHDTGDNITHDTDPVSGVILPLPQTSTTDVQPQKKRRKTKIDIPIKEQVEAVLKDEVWFREVLDDLSRKYPGVSIRDADVEWERKKWREWAIERKPGNLRLSLRNWLNRPYEDAWNTPKNNNHEVRDREEDVVHKPFDIWESTREMEADPVWVAHMKRQDPNWSPSAPKRSPA